MIDNFLFYVKIGLEHVLTFEAIDHIAFLACLCAALVLKDWKKMIALVTCFTLGHTIALLLSAYGILNLSVPFVEFLIPLTIIIAGLLNIFSFGKISNQFEKGYFFGALFFGVIHGLAYYGDLKIVLFGGNKLIRILEISIGVELAQLLVAILLLACATLFQNIFKFSKKDWVLIISSLAIGLILPLFAASRF